MATDPVNTEFEYDGQYLRSDLLTQVSAHELLVNAGLFTGDYSAFYSEFVTHCDHARRTWDIDTRD